MSNHSGIVFSPCSLLRHDSPATVLSGTTRRRVDAPVHVGLPSGRLLSRIERAATQMLQQVIGSSARRLLVIVTALLLVGLAVWMYAGMKRATQSIAASELQTILNADVTALELWIEEKKKDVRLWSSQPKMITTTSGL